MREFDEFKLARVIGACGGIDGRVKMQKIVYLLQMMGYDLPFDDFSIRQHGPFSRSVAYATDMLVGAGVLEEEKEPPDENATFVQYSYALREDLADMVLRNFDLATPSGKPPIDEIAPRLKEQERAVLEVVATQIFLEQEGLSGEDLDAELLRLKGHLSDRFPEAEELLETLRLESLL